MLEGATVIMIVAARSRRRAVGDEATEKSLNSISVEVEVPGGLEQPSDPVRIQGK